PRLQGGQRLSRGAGAGPGRDPGRRGDGRCCDSPAGPARHRPSGAGGHEAVGRDLSDMPKSSTGNFFEDFRLGQEIVHAVPRTITTGDVSLYSALYGMRFPVQSSDAFAQTVGLARAPIDNLLLFHV